MKITVRQLKQLIREQVEEATTGEKTAIERFKSALESDKSGQEDLMVYGELAKAVIDSYNRGAPPAKLIRAIKNATKTGEGDASYDQLSDVLGHPLLLVVVNVERFDGNRVDSRNFNEWVDSVRNFVATTSPKDIQKLEDLLSRVGYDPNDDYSESIFTIKGSRIFEVRDGFQHNLREIVWCHAELGAEVPEETRNQLTMQMAKAVFGASPVVPELVIVD
jgi:hypothetical protein